MDERSRQQTLNRRSPYYDDNEDFAKKNNLKVGAQVEINTPWCDNEKHANNQNEVTIVGLFGGKIKRGVTAPQELYENDLTDEDK